ncbi:MAG: hypothetical protein ABIQ97_07455 [Lysobacteraceae bacterium]
MSEVIAFLQQLGQSATLRHATKSTLYAALNAQAVDQTAQWAIMGGDVARLAALLSASTGLMCILAVAEDDGEQAAAQQDVCVVA